MKRSTVTAGSTTADDIAETQPVDKRRKQDNDDQLLQITTSFVASPANDTRAIDFNDDHSTSDQLLTVRNVADINKIATNLEPVSIVIAGQSTDTATRADIQSTTVSVNPSDLPVFTLCAAHAIKVEIKTEIKTDLENACDSDRDRASTSTAPSVIVQVKPDPDGPSSSGASVPVLPPLPPPAPPALRPTCNFGIKCFRRNLQHRNDMAHPGDPDYRRPAFAPAPSNAPDCPFGARCYRRNPVHFQQLRHPPPDVYNTDITVAPVPAPMQGAAADRQTSPVVMGRRRRAVVNRLSDSESSDDPFDDELQEYYSSDEFQPDSEEDDEDDVGNIMGELFDSDAEDVFDEFDTI